MNNLDETESQWISGRLRELAKRFRVVETSTPDGGRAEVTFTEGMDIAVLLALPTELLKLADMIDARVQCELDEAIEKIRLELGR